MRGQTCLGGNDYVQALEPRRLLSLTPISGEGAVPAPGAVKSYDIAVAGNGSSIVATVEDAAAPRLAAVRYAASGEQIGGVLTLDTLGVNFNGGAVSAAMDADGDAVVVYLLNQSELYAIRISRDGVVSPRQLIDQTISGEAEFFAPSVSMDDGGGFFVGWLSFMNTGHDDTVHVRSFDAAGVGRDTEFFVGGQSGLDHFNQLDLAAKPDGSGAVVAYHHFGEATFQLDYGQVSPSGLVGQVQHFGFVGSDGPKVAVHADGSFVMAYTRGAGGNLNGEQPDFATFAMRFDSTGKQVGREIPLGESLPGAGFKRHTHFVSVDAMPDGGFLAGFSQTFNDVTTIYARRYNAAGDSDPSAPVALGSGTSRETAVGVDGNGRGVVAWLKGTASVSEGGVVHFRRVTADEVTTVRNGELLVLGRDIADSIRITRDGGRIVVFRGETFRTFDAAGITALSINGFGGNDSISNETDLPSTLVGGDGIDTITGGLSADLIRGNGGSDSLSGGEGDDTLLGDGGLDSLSGNAGRDNVQGGAGNDRVAGNGGRDRLFGGDDDDRIFGGASGDWLFGDSGDDQINGDGGDDRIYGYDGGLDTLHGNAGNDIFSCADGEIDQVFGDGGRDTALASQNDVLISIESTG